MGDPGAVDLGEIGREFPAGIHKLGWNGGKCWSAWGKEEVNLVRRQRDVTPLVVWRLLSIGVGGFRWVSRGASPLAGWAPRFLFYRDVWLGLSVILMLTGPVLGHFKLDAEGYSDDSKEAQSPGGGWCQGLSYELDFLNELVRLYFIHTRLGTTGGGVLGKEQNSPFRHPSSWVRAWPG